MAGERFVRLDRFGRKYTVVGFKKNKNGYPVAYWNTGRQLYKFDLSPSKKSGTEYWLTITELPNNQRSMGF